MRCWLCLTVKSRNLFSIEPDGPSSDTSCGYQNALLSWLTGGFSRPIRRQQSVATWPSGDDGGTEADGGLMDERGGENRMMTAERETSVGRDGGMIGRAVERPSAEEHNKTWTASELAASTHSGIVPTKLNVTYAAATEVISVLE